MGCENHNKLTFLGYLILFVVLFSGLNSIIFNLYGNLFVIEVLFLIVSLAIGVLLLHGAYQGKRWVCAVGMIFFSVQLLNVLSLYFSSAFSKVILPLIISVLGLLMSLVFITDGSRRAKLQTYDTAEEKSEKKTVKKKSKKKTSKKKSKKKTAKKKTSKKKSKKKTSKKKAKRR